MIPCMQETSQTLIAGPEDQQKFADLEMKPQLSGYFNLSTKSPACLYNVNQYRLDEITVNC